jgi:predicted transcriptional regulator
VIAFYNHKMYNQCMNNGKTPVGFRLSERARALLAALAQKIGVNQTAIVEMAIRQMAEREKAGLAETQSSEGGQR